MHISVEKNEDLALLTDQLSLDSFQIVKIAECFPKVEISLPRLCAAYVKSEHFSPSLSPLPLIMNAPQLKELFLHMPHLPLRLHFGASSLSFLFVYARAAIFESSGELADLLVQVTHLEALHPESALYSVKSLEIITLY